MSKVRDFKFGMRIDRKAYKPGICKNTSKRAWPGSSDLLLKFWDPFYISGMSKVKDFKFGMRIDRKAYKPGI